uniref:Uncharacterized protein n=1 Tax=Tanacetum cinerariifolium TaxID=118510 RepID=A0A699H2Z0_TANCI|nr:hypothetical protein [Tanacetum cinerariifolium]
MNNNHSQEPPLQNNNSPPLMVRPNGQAPRSIEELCQPSINGRCGPIASILIQAIDFAEVDAVGSRLMLSGKIDTAAEVSEEITLISVSHIVGLDLSKLAIILNRLKKIHSKGLTSEGLHKGNDRFQTLLSQLEIHGAGVSHKDANQKINNDDMEEMDLKWKVAMISMRIKKFYKRTRRKLAKGNQDSRRRDAWYNGNKARDNGNYMPSGLDVEIDYSKFTYGPKQTLVDESNSKTSEYASCESDSSVETTTYMPKPTENAPKVVFKPKVWNDAPIIEEYESDSDSDSVSNVQEDKEKSSFAFTDLDKHVKTSRENVKELGTPNHSPKIEKQDRKGKTRKGLGYAFTRKACFVCGSFNHLIRDFDFHEKRMAKQAELT